MGRKTKTSILVPFSTYTVLAQLPGRPVHEAVSGLGRFAILLHTKGREREGCAGRFGAQKKKTLGRVLLPKKELDRTNFEKVFPVNYREE